MDYVSDNQVDEQCEGAVRALLGAGDQAPRTVILRTFSSGLLFVDATGV